jgi:hypothetical protein
MRCAVFQRVEYIFHLPHAVLNGRQSSLLSMKLLECHIGVCCVNLLSFCSQGFAAYLMFNLLKPTGHVMHQQFNIQQLYVLPTLYLCVLYLSENKQRLVPLTA